MQEEATEVVVTGVEIQNSWGINDKKIAQLKYGGAVDANYYETRGTYGEGRAGAGRRGPVSPRKTVIELDEEVITTHHTKGVDVVNFDHYFRTDTSNQVRACGCFNWKCPPPLSLLLYFFCTATPHPILALCEFRQLQRLERDIIIIAEATESLNVNNSPGRHKSIE